MPPFIRRISDSASQFLINQAFGLGLFFALSKGLDKVSFGELNWTLALFLTVFNILGLGLDQMTVRKIAAGDPPSEIVAIYRTHVFVTGAVFYGLLLGARFVVPVFFAQHALLLWIGLAKLTLFFSTPYKQLASGNEQFGVLLRMSVFSSVFKGVVLIACFLLHLLTMPLLLAVFVTGDLVEWQISAWLGRKMVPHPRRPVIDRKAWFLLIQESLPQVGVVLFSSALARFDWILIGLILSASRLAEYSFAYKAFEVSSLPLLIIAPLLIPFFTRVLGAGSAPARSAKALPFLLNGELALGCWTTLLLNVGWTPIIDHLTAGRYGAVNASTILVLSFCLPLLYLNNFLWTVHFARGRFHMIFRIFALSFACNLGGDLWLIPRYGNQGAAWAYLLAIALQTALYVWNAREPYLRRSWMGLVFLSAGAALSGYISCRWWMGVFPRLLGASFIYGLIILCSLFLQWTAVRDRWTEVRDLQRKIS